jgi:hypothetical protein
MPLRRFLEGSAFGPDDLKAMTAAFDATLAELGLTDQKDRLVESVARKIISLAKQGERDPERLRAGAVKFFKDDDAASA